MGNRSSKSSKQKQKEFNYEKENEIHLPEEFFLNGIQWNRILKYYPCQEEFKSKKEIEKEMSEKDALERLLFLTKYEYSDHSKPNDKQSSFKKIIIINLSLLSPKIFFIPLKDFEEEEDVNIEELRKRSVERIYRNKNEPEQPKPQEINEEEMFFEEYINHLKMSVMKLEILSQFSKEIKNESNKTPILTDQEYRRVFAGVTSLFHVTMALEAEIRKVKESKIDFQRKIGMYARATALGYPFLKLYKYYYFGILRNYFEIFKKTRDCERFRDLKIKLEEKYSEKLEDLMFIPITQMKILYDFASKYLERYSNRNDLDDSNITLYSSKMERMIEEYNGYVCEPLRIILLQLQKVYEMLSETEFEVVFPDINLSSKIKKEINIFNGVGMFKTLRITEGDDDEMINIDIEKEDMFEKKDNLSLIIRDGMFLFDLNLPQKEDRLVFRLDIRCGEVWIYKNEKEEDTVLIYISFKNFPKKNERQIIILKFQHFNEKEKFVNSFLSIRDLENEKKE